MRCNSFVFPAPGKTKQQKKMQLHLGEQENGHTFTTINKAKLMKTLKKKKDLLELKLWANATMKIYSPEKWYELYI